MLERCKKGFAELDAELRASFDELERRVACLHVEWWLSLTLPEPPVTQKPSKAIDHERQARVAGSCEILVLSSMGGRGVCFFLGCGVVTGGGRLFVCFSGAGGGSSKGGEAPNVEEAKMDSHHKESRAAPGAQPVSAWGI